MMYNVGAGSFWRVKSSRGDGKIHESLMKALKYAGVASVKPPRLGNNFGSCGDVGRAPVSKIWTD